MKSKSSVFILLIQILTFAVVLTAIIISDRVFLSWSGSASTTLICSFFAVISNIAMHFIYNFFEDTDGFFAVLSKIIAWPVGVASAGLCALCCVFGIIAHWEDFSPWILSFEFMWVYSIVISFSVFVNAVDDDDGSSALFVTPLSIIISYVVALPIAFLICYIPIEFFRFVVFFIYSAIAIVIILSTDPSEGLGGIISSIGGLFAELFDTGSSSSGGSNLSTINDNKSSPVSNNDTPVVDIFTRISSIEDSIDDFIRRRRGLSLYCGRAEWKYIPHYCVLADKVSLRGIVVIHSSVRWGDDRIKEAEDELSDSVLSALTCAVEEGLSKCKYKGCVDYTVSSEVSFEYQYP